MKRTDFFKKLSMLPLVGAALPLLSNLVPVVTRTSTVTVYQGEAALGFELDVPEGTAVIYGPLDASGAQNLIEAGFDKVVFNLEGGATSLIHKLTEFL